MRTFKFVPKLTASAADPPRAIKPAHIARRTGRKNGLDMAGSFKGLAWLISPLVSSSDKPVHWPELRRELRELAPDCRFRDRTVANGVIRKGYPQFRRPAPPRIVDNIRLGARRYREPKKRPDRTEQAP